MALFRIMFAQRERGIPTRMIFEPNGPKTLAEFHAELAKHDFIGGYESTIDKNPETPEYAKKYPVVIATQHIISVNHFKPPEAQS